jgi:hypothetical protein
VNNLGVSCSSDETFNYFENTTNNRNPSNSFNPKIKSSYDKVFNELSKIEKNSKEIATVKKELEDRKIYRIKMLELKLQGFCEEIKNVNFNNIHKQLEDLALSGKIDPSDLNNNAQKSSNLLISNDNNVRYKCNYDRNYLSESFEEALMNKNSQSDQKTQKNNELINQILNLNSTKGGDMIQFIESLLMKTESEIGLNETVKNLKINK